MSKSKAETIAFRRDKLEECLQAALTLIDAENWPSAVNRLYYSVFHVVSALMLQRDIRVKTHTGAKAMFE